MIAMSAALRLLSGMGQIQAKQTTDQHVYMSAANFKFIPLYGMLQRL